MLEVLWRRCWVVLMVALPLVWAGAARGDDSRLCGLKCLSAAGAALGVPVDSAKILKPEYCSTDEGSSLEELKLAAGVLGLDSKTVKVQSIYAVRALAWSKQPTILHVRSQPSSATFDHYVLVLGESPKGEAIIYDPLSGKATEQAWEGIARTWSGAAVVVGNDVSLWPVYGIRAFQVIALGGMLVCCLWVGRVIQGRVSGWHFAGRSAAMGGYLTLACGLMSPMLGWVMGNDFAWNQGSARYVEEWHTDYWLKKATLKEVAGDLAKDRRNVIVDSRSVTQFQDGHLPGAVLYAYGDTGPARALAGVSRSAPIVVYCESPTCGVAARVGQRLISQGFKDVRIYEGGWQEWNQASRAAPAGEGADHVRK